MHPADRCITGDATPNEVLEHLLRSWDALEAAHARMVGLAEAGCLEGEHAQLPACLPSCLLLLLLLLVPTCRQHLSRRLPTSAVCAPTGGQRREAGQASGGAATEAVPPALPGSSARPSANQVRNSRRVPNKFCRKRHPIRDLHPVDPNIDGHVEQFLRLLPEHSTERGTVHFSDMTLAWNMQHYQLSRNGTVPSFKPTSARYLRQFHADYRRMQEVQATRQPDPQPADPQPEPSPAQQPAAVGGHAAPSEQRPEQQQQQPAKNQGGAGVKARCMGCR